MTGDAVRQFVQFCAVGLVNTCIHLLVVVAGVESGLAGPMPANVMAFCCANTFSFWANSRFTFRAGLAWNRWRRFVVVSVAGLALAAACSAAAGQLGWHYLGGVLLTFAIMPALSFTANRFWTWR